MNSLPNYEPRENRTALQKDPESYKLLGKYFINNFRSSENKASKSKFVPKQKTKKNKRINRELIRTTLFFSRRDRVREGDRDPTKKGKKNSFTSNKKKQQ